MTPLEKKLRRQESSSVTMLQPESKSHPNTDTDCGNGGPSRCSALHLRPGNQQSLSVSPETFEMLLRDMVISWSLHLENPNVVSSLLLHYGRLASGRLVDSSEGGDTSPEKTLFRMVLDEMIAERREQGGSRNE